MNDTVKHNNLSVEDIHKIRYANYERIKGMTHQEIIEHTRREAQYGLNLLQSMREKRGDTSGNAEVTK